MSPYNLRPLPVTKFFMTAPSKDKQHSIKHTPHQGWNAYAHALKEHRFLPFIDASGRAFRVHEYRIDDLRRLTNLIDVFTMGTHKQTLMQLIGGPVNRKYCKLEWVPALLQRTTRLLRVTDARDENIFYCCLLVDDDATYVQNTDFLQSKEYATNEQLRNQLLEFITEFNWMFDPVS